MMDQGKDYLHCGPSWMIENVLMNMVIEYMMGRAWKPQLTGSVRVKMVNCTTANNVTDTIPDKTGEINQDDTKIMQMVTK